MAQSNSFRRSLLKLITAGSLLLPIGCDKNPNTLPSKTQIEGIPVSSTYAPCTYQYNKSKLSIVIRTGEGFRLCYTEHGFAHDEALYNQAHSIVEAARITGEKVRVNGKQNGDYFYIDSLECKLGEDEFKLDLNEPGFF